MKQRMRVYYTETQKAVMSERWKSGESLHQIARLPNRNHSFIQKILRASRPHTQKTDNHGRITDTISISERPAMVEDRALPGH